MPLAPELPGELVVVRRTRTPTFPKLAFVGTEKLIVRFELLVPVATATVERPRLRLLLVEDNLTNQLVARGRDARVVASLTTAARRAQREQREQREMRAPAELRDVSEA